MKKVTRIYQIPMLLLFILYACSCKKTDVVAPATTIELNNLVSKKAGFIIKSSKITQTQTGYKFTGELLTQSDKGETFGLGTGDFEIDTATDGSVKSVKGIGMAAFPSVGVFGEILKTFAWKQIKAHIEYQTGQYFIDTYGTELPLTPDRWYLHFKRFDENPGTLFELKQKLNSLAYHFSDFYLDPLDPSFLMKTDISIPEDLASSEVPGYAGVFLNHVAQGINDENPIPLKAMLGISNQGLFHSKAYEFPVKNKDFFKSKYGMNSFESSSSNYFAKMDEPGIPVPYTEDMLNIIGEEYLHQPAIMTKLGDFSQAGLLDYLNNSYKGGYMLNFNGKLRFGGHEYFSALLNGMGTLNDIVGKDVFNTDIDLELSQATLQVQFPGTIEGAGSVPSYFRFGGMTKAPLASDIFGADIRKYIPSFTPPAIQQFFYVSAGPTKDDCSIYLETGAKILVPLYGDLDLGSADFYISKKGIEMISSSDINVGPFKIDGDIKGDFNTKHYSLHMESNADFTVKNIKFGSSHMVINASSDKGMVFQGNVKLPYGLGTAYVQGKIANGAVSFAGELAAGTNLNLPNGMKLPTANMKFTFDESDGFSLEGKVNIPFVGWAAVKGKISDNNLLLEGSISAGGIKFGSTTLPYATGKVSISLKGVNFSANFNLGPLGNFEMSSGITTNNIYFNAKKTISLTIAGFSHEITDCEVIANTSIGVLIYGKMDLYFTKVSMAGVYSGINNFSLSGSTDIEVGKLKLLLSADVNATSITLRGSGSVAGHKQEVRLTPDWRARTLKVCWDAPIFGEKCVTVE